MRPYITGQAISADRFTWENRHGAAELSDFVGSGLPHHQVWPDSCDIGLTVISEATGAALVFVQENNDTDADGDVTAFRYIALDPTTGRPDKRDDAHRLTLFND